jgi:hypothetical protein
MREIDDLHGLILSEFCGQNDWLNRVTPIADGLNRGRARFMQGSPRLPAMRRQP